MTETDEAHWESVYGRRKADEVSWFRPHLEKSLSFVKTAGLEPSSPIIDVGGGASTFVDDLLLTGYTDITVLDISSAALDVAKRRLGDREGLVRWVVGDITRVELPENHYAFWNDRAVFHFLTREEQRQRYVALALRALKGGAHIVVGTFGPDGPERCSGLPVVRFSPEGLHAEFGASFQKLSALSEVHSTPSGAEQQFVYCYCKVLR